MKTTLTIIFATLVGTAGFAVEKSGPTNTSTANDRLLYACVYYPLCTIPDLYSPVSKKGSKDKPKDTSNDKLKLA